MIILASYPILSIKERGIRRIIPPNHKVFKLVCIVIIVFSFVSLPNTIISIHDNLIKIILDNSYGSEVYGKQTLAVTTKTTSQFNILAILGGMCGQVAIIFFMYCLTLEKRNRFLLCGLGISSLIGPLGSVANGGRFSLAVFIFNSTFLFVFIRRFISPSLRSKVTKIILIIGIILFIPFMAITISRNNGDYDKSIRMIGDYISQGFIHFNNYGLDAGGTREGDYTAVVFKYVTGMNPAMYYSSRLSKYSHMKLDETVFYTFVGDFTLDYGPILAFLIFLLTSLFFKRCLKIRNNEISFQQYLMFYLLMVGCLGYFQFPLGRTDGNLVIIILIMLSFLFKYSSDIDSRKTRSRY